MPLGQSLRRAFLKIPCGSGGSQSRKDDPGVIPPSRVCSPQLRQSDIAAPVPSIPRTKRAPNIHEDLSKPPRASTSGAARAEMGTDRGTPEVKRLSAIGPDYDQNPKSTRDSGHNRNLEPVCGAGYSYSSEPIHDIGHTPEPLTDRENITQPASPLRDKSQRYSTDSQTSDYSNHSITHSLRPTSRPVSRIYGQGINAEPCEAGKPTKPKITTHPAAPAHTTGGAGSNAKSDTTFLIPANKHDNPVSYDKRPGPRQPLGTVLSFVNNTRANTGDAVEEVVTELEPELGGYGRESGEGGGRNTRESPCANEICQGTTLEKQCHQYQPPIHQSPITSIQTKSLDPITRTRIRPIEREEVTNLITREIHYTDIHPTIQPITTTERLPQKHYLQTLDGKLTEISAEDAEREGWDEVWRGDLVSDQDINNKSKPEAGVEEVRGNLSSLTVGHNSTASLPVLEAPYGSSYEEGVYEPYGNGNVMNNSNTGLPVPLDFARTGSPERAEELRMSRSFGERNVLVGPAH